MALGTISLPIFNITDIIRFSLCISYISLGITCSIIISAVFAFGIFHLYKFTENLSVFLVFYSMNSSLTVLKCLCKVIFFWFSIVSFIIFVLYFLSSFSPNFSFYSIFHLIALVRISV